MLIWSTVILSFLDNLFLRFQILPPYIVFALQFDIAYIVREFFYQNSLVGLL